MGERKATQNENNWGANFFPNTGTPFLIVLEKNVR